MGKIKKIKDETFTLIEIKNGKNDIYNFRQKFNNDGFEFNERAYGKSFYSKRVYSDDEIKEYQKFCRHHKLSFTATPGNYCRSTDYRKTFFSNNKPHRKNKYRCAYCGKWLKKEKVTVDHIIPVNGMKTSSVVRFVSKLIGIKNVNGVNNLCAACEKCNKRKSAKLGLWPIKGFLGRSYLLWNIRIILRILILIAIIYFLYQYTDLFSVFDKINIGRGTVW